MLGLRLDSEVRDLHEVLASLSLTLTLTLTLSLSKLGGILPFGACFVALFFIMRSIWMDQYYYVFGFLLLVYG